MPARGQPIQRRLEVHSAALRDAARVGLTVRRLLFVDDDAPILRALERMLRVQCSDWECHFVDDPDRALALVEHLAPDAVVSDMLMPGLDGAEFLTRAARLRPLMARFILSGEVGAGSLARMAGAAHQCLSKPCRGDVLIDVLRRALIDHSAIKVPALAEGLYGVHGLPVAASSFDQLRSLLAKRSGHACDAEAVAVIEGDAAMATRLVQVATWTRLGGGAPPAHVYGAYLQLGPDGVRTLVDAELVRPLSGGDTTPFQGRVWRRSSNVAAVAGAIVQSEGGTLSEARRAALVALLGTAAPLLVDGVCRQAYADIRQTALQTGTRLAVLEREHFGLTAAESFAQMLRLWGLGEALAARVAAGDEVAAFSQDGLGPDGVAHVARVVVDSLGGVPAPAATTAYLTRLGLAGRLDGWQAAAARTVGPVAA